MTSMNTEETKLISLKNFINILKMKSVNFTISQYYYISQEHKLLINNEVFMITNRYILRLSMDLRPGSINYNDNEPRV